MRVRHVFADDLAQDHLLAKGFLLGQSDIFDDFKISSGIWYIPNPPIMFFWYDESMPRRLWVDIEESQKIAIIIHDMRRDFFFDDFAEDAVLHVDIVSKKDNSVLITTELCLIGLFIVMMKLFFEYFLLAELVL